MPKLDNQDNEAVIVNFVDDSIVPDAAAVKVVAAYKLAAAIGSRLACQFVDGSPDALPDLR